MSSARDMPGRIVVAGDGQLGALAAIALRRASPTSSVMVIGTPADHAALADRAVTALPFTNRLHDRLGIGEERLVREAGASHRLVVRYRNWGGSGQQGIVAYGSTLAPDTQTAFARKWGGTTSQSQASTPHGSIAEALASAGHFAPPPDDCDSVLADLDYALRWNREAYHAILIADGAALGIEHRSGIIQGVSPDGNGGVAALHLADGTTVAADLFIDCTGPGAAILSHLPAATRTDWSAMLPVRQLVYARGSQPVLALDDRVALTSAGWVAETAGRDGREAVLGLPEGRDESAARALFGTDAVISIPISPGRAREAWLGNVVALGDAAASFEPLGWLNLDVAHRQLDLLLEMLPGSICNPLERGEFNRRAGLIADRARDIVASHYVSPAAPAFYGAITASPELELALDQFTRRGRLPMFEEAPVTAREWTGILLALGLEAGQGALDRAEGTAKHEAAIADIAARQATAMAMTPPYADWLRTVLSRG